MCGNLQGGRKKLLCGIYSHSYSQVWSEGRAGFEFSMRSPIKFVAISVSLQLNQFSVQL
jgi:hypothetical protein